MKQFPKASKICIVVSIAIMVLALALTLFGQGIRLGLDFTGGMTLAYDMKAPFEQKDVEEALKNQGIENFQLSKTGSDQTNLEIRIPQMNEEGVQVLQEALEKELSAKYPQMDVENAKVSYVGPVAGRNLVKNAIISVLAATVLMLVYIGFRFDLYSGMAAVVGLAHDVLIMLSFMVILRNLVQLNSSFIAAALTIVGYSINNTIVIFDRIRENNRSGEYAKMEKRDLVSTSVKQSLGRTINTTLTTLIMIVGLYILGVDSIKEFALPIIVGIVSGIYSANMINGYVWATFESKGKSKKAAGVKKAKKA